MRPPRRYLQNHWNLYKAIGPVSTRVYFMVFNFADREKAHFSAKALSAFSTVFFSPTSCFADKARLCDQGTVSSRRYVFLYHDLWIFYTFIDDLAIIWGGWSRSKRLSGTLTASWRRLTTGRLRCTDGVCHTVCLHGLMSFCNLFRCSRGQWIQYI